MSREIVFGIHAVKARIKIHPDAITTVYCIKGKERQSKMVELLNAARQKSIAIELVNKTRFMALIAENEAEALVHQDVIALCHSDIALYDEPDIDRLLPTDRPAFVLILDGIVDPHNLGACIRSANAAGADFVVFPKDKNAAINATVKKVACGAVESTKLVAVTNLSRAIKRLQQQGVWITGLAGEGAESIYEVDLRQSSALVMGAEGSGLRHGTRKVCDYLVRLPMAGEVSSLNVSVAAGIAMYELVRQRL
ncbi:MAG: 23S rRNA (guanosine(2251)-2'-O)-methyltransferase RlmB [Francisellaceae bacterium]